MPDRKELSESAGEATGAIEYTLSRFAEVTKCWDLPKVWLWKASWCMGTVPVAKDWSILRKWFEILPGSDFLIRSSYPVLNTCGQVSRLATNRERLYRKGLISSQGFSLVEVFLLVVWDNNQLLCCRIEPLDDTRRLKWMRVSPSRRDIAKRWINERQRPGACGWRFGLKRVFHLSIRRNFIVNVNITPRWQLHVLRCTETKCWSVAKSSEEGRGL